MSLFAARCDLRQARRDHDPSRFEPRPRAPQRARTGRLSHRDMPITMSRTVRDPVKWRSTWGVVGIGTLRFGAGARTHEPNTMSGRVLIFLAAAGGVLAAPRRQTPGGAGEGRRRRE